VGRNVAAYGEFSVAADNLGPQALETFAAILVIVFVAVVAGGMSGLLVSLAVC
jgi:hypothetical protein